MILCAATAPFTLSLAISETSGVFPGTFVRWAGRWWRWPGTLPPSATPSLWKKVAKMGTAYTWGGPTTTPSRAIPTAWSQTASSISSWPGRTRRGRWASTPAWHERLTWVSVDLWTCAPHTDSALLSTVDLTPFSRRPFLVLCLSVSPPTNLHESFRCPHLFYDVCTNPPVLAANESFIFMVWMNRLCPLSPSRVLCWRAGISSHWLLQRRCGEPRFKDQVAMGQNGERKGLRQVPLFPL